MRERETGHARLLHAPECITKLFISHSKSDQLSLGSHSLVALPSNAAREGPVRFAARAGAVLASVFTCR